MPLAASEAARVPATGEVPSQSIAHWAGRARPCSMNSGHETWLSTTVLAFALFSGTAAASDCCDGTAAVAINIAPDFTTFWDATKDLPMAQRVAAFHRDLEPKFPEFYSAARFAKPGGTDDQDERIAAAISKFPEIRAKYTAKVAAFNKALTDNMASFLRAFPDYVPKVPVALVHSLGEMDGGGRTLTAKDGTKHDWLIFGADVMAQLHDFADESAFFHHELFHTYHHAADGCEKVICALWQEGLAVYVASALHPTAGFPELLLNIPPDLVSGTEARRREAFAQLEGVLNSTNDKVLGGLFMFEDDGSGLPRRRGYYLGLVVARELGKKRTLTELAHMPMSEAEPLIRTEVAHQAH